MLNSNGFPVESQKIPFKNGIFAADFIGLQQRISAGK